MFGRRSAHHGRPFLRALTAAVLAATALIAAANTGPARATDTAPATPAAQEQAADR
ncbi:hypothetical protein [Streptomyces sp. NPDC002588]|uniref:hypothetical protein n=1 Tax=Streptomyces sp. NPDC002588 TaxID=3154419 RepID=UPI003329C1A1